MAAVNALNSLLKSTSIEDHEEALTLADAAVSAGKAGSPEKLTAQHTKVVALLMLDRFADALRVISDAGDALASRCVLEHAYALYKTGDLEAAEALLDEDDSNRALQHVAAQAAYRGERFVKASNLYERLAKVAAAENNAEEASDIRINALAAGAQQAWADAEVAPSTAALDAGRREDLEVFELACNSACIALASGDVARASVMLRRAQQLCEASDNLSDDDKQVELLPVLVQQAYALTRLGRHEEAAKLQKAVDLTPCEGSLAVVNKMNGLLPSPTDTNTTTNPYILHRDFEAVPAPPTGSDRLFAHQARILRRNQFAIELQCFKFKGVQARTKKAKGGETHAETVDLGVFHAAAKAEMQTGKVALRRILPLLAHRPDDVGLLLTAVHLQLQEKNPEAAVSLLEEFFKRLSSNNETSSQNARFAPGLVALAVSLYKLQGRHAAVRSELAQAVAHWQKKSDASSASPLPTSLLRAAGVELLRSPIPADQATAAAAFEQLHAADPADKIAVAGLVASTPSSSTNGAQQQQQSLATSLTPVDQLVKGIDVSKLLQGGVAVLPAPAAAATSKKRAAPTAAADAATAPAAAEETPAAKKTKTAAGKAQPATPAAATRAENQKLSRQARKLQAKDESAFDPNKKLDAERWLPLRDRSSYRPPKGKKGGRNNNRRGGADTMQGGVVKEEETLALAGGAGSVKVEKAPASGGGAAKKRKKGKK